MIAGKDKGKKGKVSKAIPELDKVVVEGANMRKKSLKAKKKGAKGQIVEFVVPIHISNVAIADPKTGKPSRIGIKVEGGKRIRIAKKSGQKI